MKRRAEDEAFVEDLLTRLAPLGELRAQRMFDGIGLYCDELFFGLIDDGVLFFKVDAESAKAYRAAGSGPFQPFPDRPLPDKGLGGYYEVPLGVQERDEELCRWARRALEVARSAGVRKRGRRSPEKARSVPVAKLENIGPKSAAWLRAVGITTRAELERAGSVGAYRRVVEAGFEPSLQLLYALEGALLELRADRLPEAVRENLRQRAARSR
jgi:TfoX/Sxy family transcriptional regulator of competence genes